MLKKLINWLGGHSEDKKDWHKSYDDLRQSFDVIDNAYFKLKNQLNDYNYLLRWRGCIKKKETLETVCLYYGTYILYKCSEEVGMNTNVCFVIQIRYPRQDNEFFVSSFSDKDEEYAENCAREALEYLTKEI